MTRDADRIARECGLVNLTFPLRPDFIVHLQVPTDMTTRECARLVAMLETLPAPPPTKGE